MQIPFIQELATRRSKSQSKKKPKRNPTSKEKTTSKVAEKGKKLKSA